MLRFQSGDESAFENLIRQYQDMVHAFLFRFRGRDEGVEDLAQEVFLRVYRSRKNYRPDAKFSTWIYRIVCNLCINEVRDKKPSVSLQGGAESGPSAPAPQWQDARAKRPLEEMQDHEFAKLMRESLDELPENQRAAVLLHRYHDMSYRAIGEALGVSEKAVKSLMARARERLKIKLSPYFREEVSG